MSKEDRASGGAVVREFSLRPVQVAALQGIASHWRNADGKDRRALTILPTGVGKTITALEACRKAVEKGKRVLWIAHREELVTQPYHAIEAIEHFASAFAVAGIVKGSLNQPERQLVFSSVQTMAHRAESYLSHGRPDLVVVDEAHHYAPGSSWYDVVLGLIGAVDGVGGCYVIGLTATPQRGDNVKLSPMWGMYPAFSFGLTEAMRDGYLLEPVFVPAPMEMSEDLCDALETANSDGATDIAKQLAKQLLDEGIAEHTALTVQSVAKDEKRHQLVYCASVKQVDRTVDEIRALGMRAESVTGETPKNQRADILDRFHRGQIDALVNCDVLTEGTDLPIADTIVLARPCGSKALYIQIVGRGARLYPGQEQFLVVDILGASKVHSLEQAPVLDIGRDEVDTAKPGDADLSIVAVGNYEDPHIMAPEGSLWTADVLSVERVETPSSPMCGTVKVRGPYKRSIGGRDIGQFKQAEKKGEKRPDIIVNVGPMCPFMVYHAIRVPRFARSEQWEPAWVRVMDGVLGVDMADHGVVMLVQEIDGAKWWPVLVVKGGRKPRELSQVPLDLSIAEMVVRDLVGRASKEGRDGSSLIRKGATWRDAPPTAAQIARLERAGVQDAPTTKGEATRMITLEKLSSRVTKLGLVPGWRPASYVDGGAL